MALGLDAIEAPVGRVGAPASVAAVDHLRDDASCGIDPGDVLSGDHTSGSRGPRDGVATRDLLDVRENCLTARKEAGHVRRAYVERLTQTVSAELTMETLKTRELLRRLDVIGPRICEGADALLD